jgi:schlafen family protein
MIIKPFDLIEKADIEALVANDIREGRTLDYKEKLPGNADSDKTEFLADVSSFANAAGGYLLYGVRERRDADGKPTGMPESVDGLQGINPDSEILRLESSIRTAIDPRVPGVRTKPIDGFSQGPVLAMWIPKSWSAPHMVTFKNHSRFYSRSSNGKYALDVSEIRLAFAVSESLGERLRRFRDDRLAKIVADETPFPLHHAPKIVLHILPVAALEPGTSLDVMLLADKLVQLGPLYASGWDSRYNFDGFATFSRSGDAKEFNSYLQVFRNGAIETVESRLLRPYQGKTSIPSVAYERELITGFGRYLRIERDLGFQPPLFIMISFIGVKGYVMAVSERFLFPENHPIDKDVLIVPDIIIEDYNVEPAIILRPAFDAVWQAAGWQRSFNYNKDGKWVGQ